MLRVLLFVVGCAVVLIACGSLAKDMSTVAGMCLTGALASLLTFLLTLVFVRWDGLELRAVGAAWSRDTVWRVGCGFGIGLAIVAMEDAVVFAGGHVHWVATRGNGLIGRLLLALATYFLLALREELAYHGYPLRRLDSAWGMWPALVSLAVMFGVEHHLGGWTWWSALTGPVAGAMLFGMAALATRGLAVPVGIHAAFNFGQWVMGQKETDGVLRPVVERGFAHRTEILGYSGFFVGIVLATACFWWWLKYRAQGRAGSEG